MPSKSQSFLPLGRESATEKGDREKEMKSFTMKAIEEANPTPFEEPTDWGGSLTIKSRKKDLDNLGTIISETTAATSNHNDIIQIYKAAGNPLAMTIASGQKGVIQVLHHIDQVGTKTSALLGLGNDATPVELEADRLFSKKKERLLSLDQIGNLEDFTTLPKPKAKTQEAPVANTLFFPQALGSHIVKNLNSNKASDVLELTLNFVQETDLKNGIETFTTVDPNEEEEEEEEDEQDLFVKRKPIIHEVHKDSAIHEHSHLIKTLSKWASAPRAIQAAALPTEDEGVKLWSKDAHNKILAKEQDEPNKTDKSILDSPKTKNPNVNLTGTPTKMPPAAPETLNPRNLTNTFNKAGGALPSTPRINNKNTTQTLPPSPSENNLNQTPPAGTSPFTEPPNQQDHETQPDPNLILQSLLQQANNNIRNGNTNPNDNGNGGTDMTALLHATIASLVYGQKKSTDVQERLVEVQEATLKLKEESSKTKISDPVANFLKNAFTTDGFNPLDDIPEGLKTLMKTKSEETAMNLDLVLNREKTKAKPTTSFIKALNKGTYTHEIGKPGGLTLLSIPYTLMGSGQENVDIEQLLAMESNGDDLSPQQKKILSETSIHPPRTMNYALRMAQAFKSTIKEGGDDSIPLAAIDQMCEWIAENEQTLSEYTAAFDKHLPAKLIYTVGAQFNSYFIESKFRVPSQTWLDFDNLQRQLLSNQYYIPLPESVTTALDPKRKREDVHNNNNNNGHESKKRMVIQEHKNQPIQLKSNRDFHSKVINPFLRKIRELDISAPKFDDHTQECLRFSLLGECNSNCSRKKAHKPVQPGSKRYKQLLEFRKKAVEHYNQNKSNDDPNFS